MKLFAKCQEVRMLNLRPGDENVAALLLCLETQDTHEAGD